MTETVALLHGLARTRHSMWPMQRALKRAGYRVLNIGYPSRRAPIEQLAEPAFEKITRSLPAGFPGPLHFVTHSMGGILLRYYHARHGITQLGRVVMLAPPNQGSELVDRLGRYWFFRAINGPAGVQLGTGPDSLPRCLPPVDFELGVVAGTHGINPLFSRWLPKPNDGKVTVTSARVGGMRDFRALPVTHTFMMGNRQVIELTLNFLRHGSFGGG